MLDAHIVGNGNAHRWSNMALPWNGARFGQTPLNRHCHDSSNVTYHIFARECDSTTACHKASPFHGRSTVTACSRDGQYHANASEWTRFISKVDFCYATRILIGTSTTHGVNQFQRYVAQQCCFPDYSLTARGKLTDAGASDDFGSR